MYDVIILGAGGVGSAALFHLARRGFRVLGLDRFPPGHKRGSSHGQTRAIRQAYFEHPDYVPLLLRAYDLWEELQALRERRLYNPVGLLEIGPPEGSVVPNVLQAAAKHQLAVQSLSRQEVAERFPGFVLPENCAAVFEQQAGYLLVEECVMAHAELAQQHGAELAIGEAVASWAPIDGAVQVRTASQTYLGKQLVIAAGAWAGEMLADCGFSLRVLRKHLHWCANEDARYQQENGAPVFLYETPQGVYYGFPHFDRRGLKVAMHSGGETLDATRDNLLNTSREVDPQERRQVEQFLQAHLPGVSQQPTDHESCFYTMSADEHFVIDRHRRAENVWFAAGLSGHGFKFASVLGEVLADLCEHGRTELPIEFLRRR